MQFWNTATPILSRAAVAAMAEMSFKTKIINASDPSTEKSLPNTELDNQY